MPAQGAGIRVVRSRKDQAPLRVLATSAAKSSSFFSMPSPTITRA
ncbi:hypothetical protein MGSAQ_000237 [marine sediment metagenome]|uniref:Uncharacterized protein n=1 Tax=marine sediment metagenome TaxID=412755 RepID=A0A1B6NYZ4_9ZZZZ